MKRAKTMGWAGAALVAGLAACERAPTTRATPEASAGGAAAARAQADAATTAPTAGGALGPRASLPPEPPCAGGTGPVRIAVCREPAAGDAAPGYPAPYERCMASLDGHPFSAELTAAERGRGPGATCCYLDRCQISYGY